jgi:tetraacyldisaccharide 4'-kinase
VLQRLKILLYPLAMIYGLIVRLRNHLYNIGYKKEISFDVMTIGVGNLAMGGTGKTPLTEYLIRSLKDQFKIAVLSRGYGRSSSGVKMVTQDDTVRTVGDEPMQVFRKFNNEVVVCVGENRLLAIPQILAENSDVNLIVLDDVYQHRNVKPALNVLLTNYSSPFYFDWIFPAGWLREPRRGARRADAIIISKCPVKMEPEEMDRMRKSIKEYSHAPVFFSSLEYDEPVAFGSSGEIRKAVVVVSAIANNYLFRNHCQSSYHVVKHFAFPDHHYYTAQDIRTITDFAKSKDASIVTTEKDMVKLLNQDSLIKDSPWFYLGIRVTFLNGEKDFRGMILEKARLLHSSQN